MSLSIELKDSAEQTAFNLERWAQVLADPELARLPHRIETDRHGHIVMSPPPAPAHGEGESEIVFQLKTLLPERRTITNCPVSTSDGVKAPDVAWVANSSTLIYRERGAVLVVTFLTIEQSLNADMALAAAAAIFNLPVREARVPPLPLTA